MKAVSGKDFVRVIQRHGWQLKRVNGSHHIFAKHESNLRLSIPIYGNTPLKSGLLRHLMKMAELNEDDF